MYMYVLSVFKRKNKHEQNNNNNNKTRKINYDLSKQYRKSHRVFI